MPLAFIPYRWFESRVHRPGRLLCSLFVVALTATSCSAPDQEVSPVDMGMPVVFENVAWGHSGKVRDTVETVYRDSSAWQAGSSALTLLGEARKVDFSQNMVVLVAIPTASGGYLVSVDGIDEYDDHIEVTYTLTAPGPNCITIQAMGLAFRAVAARKSDLPARFVRLNESNDCSL